METVMARTVQVQLLDDIDGGKAVETLTYGLDGTSYEIDVSAEHAEKLRASLAKVHPEVPPGGPRQGYGNQPRSWRCGASSQRPGSEPSHPRLGQEQGSRCQRPWPDPGEHRRAV
jgi:hypothetical protein